MTMEIEVTKGCRYFPHFLNKTHQLELLQHIRESLSNAPLFQPVMPKTGKPFSVRMSNMGKLGWVSDQKLGYRYQGLHPDTGQPWPKIPPLLHQLWQELTHDALQPEACLINYYEPKARMSLHRDNDEQNQQAPILSISLGDKARFRLGGLRRKGPTRTLFLESGDILILEPPMRLAYHGIDHILGGSSRLLLEGGRFNLTMRRVNPAERM